MAFQDQFKEKKPLFNYIFIYISVFFIITFAPLLVKMTVLLNSCYVGGHCCCWVQIPACAGMTHVGDDGYSRDMERWSDIRSTFKYFGLGRPPAYEKIQASETLKRRVTVMNRVKNFLKKNGMFRISLSGLKKSEIDNLLSDTCDSLGVQVRV